MKDRYGHMIPKIEDEIMAHFDTQIRGDFGNTAEILQAASKDLAADNAKAAAEDYGRCTSNHHACAGRDAALKAQIELLIFRGNNLADDLRMVYEGDGKDFYSSFSATIVLRWDSTANRARELIK